MRRRGRDAAGRVRPADRPGRDTTTVYVTHNLATRRCGWATRSPCCPAGRAGCARCWPSTGRSPGATIGGPGPGGHRTGALGNDPRRCGGGRAGAGPWLTLNSPGPAAGSRHRRPRAVPRPRVRAARRARRRGGHAAVASWLLWQAGASAGLDRHAASCRRPSASCRALVSACDQRRALAAPRRLAATPGGWLDAGHGVRRGARLRGRAVELAAQRPAWPWCPRCSPSRRSRWCRCSSSGSASARARRSRPWPSACSSRPSSTPPPASMPSAATWCAWARPSGCPAPRSCARSCCPARCPPSSAAAASRPASPSSCWSPPR